MPAELRVFWCDPYHVVAESGDEAVATVLKEYGIDRDEVGDPEELPDDETILIAIDERGQISDGPDRLRMTAREWAAREGRGVLCSTEY